MRYEVQFEDLDGNELAPPNPDITWRVQEMYVDFAFDNEGTIGFTLRIKPAKIQFIVEEGSSEIVVVEEPEEEG